MSYDITVVIPYYNEERTLDKTLEIISQQTNHPKEVIFVNSSSTDTSSKLLDIWIKKHQGENGTHYRNIFEYTDTPSSSKNVGIRLAKTEWIAFMDCGLLFPKNWLELQISYIKSSGLDIVSGVCDLTGVNVIDCCCVANTYGYHRKRIVVPSTLIRKSVFEKVGLFLENRRSAYDHAWKIYLKKTGLVRGENQDVVIRYNGINFADSYFSLFKKMVLYLKSAVGIRDYYVPYLYLVVFLLLCISMVFNYMVIMCFILFYILAKWFVLPIIKSRGILVFLHHPLTIIHMLPVAIVMDIGRIIGIFKGVYFCHLSRNPDSKKKRLNSK